MKAGKGGMLFCGIFILLFLIIPIFGLQSITGVTVNEISLNSLQGYFYSQIVIAIIFAIVVGIMLKNKSIVMGSNPDDKLADMRTKADRIARQAGQVSTNLKTVAGVASELGSLISTLSGMATEISKVFKDLVTNAQKTSDNVETMADSGVEMSKKVEKIAEAIEDMNRSLSEVAKNTAQARNISKDANDQAIEINSKMEGLVETSKQIGNVVAVIKGIADQTNLLSLNATIEAARAGEAGKGFSVVAGEVKELAKQSASATDEIAGQIKDIQNSVDKAVDSIKKINSIINEIDAINKTIASSVEKQTNTSNIIAKTVAETAEDSRSVAERAQDSSELVKRIAISTDEVSNTATELTMHIGEMGQGSAEITKSSKDAVSGINDMMRLIRQISSVEISDISSADKGFSSSTVTKGPKDLSASLDVMSFGDDDLANSLTNMGDKDLDKLAFGVVKLDRAGRVLQYNSVEGDITGRNPKEMIGKSFFTEVAPCTNTPEFRGKFDTGVKNDSLNVMFEYKFDYKMAPTRVKIHMKKGMVRNEYWVFVKRL